MDAGASVTDRDRYVCRRTLRLPAGAGARYTQYDLYGTPWISTSCVPRHLTSLCPISVPYFCFQMWDHLSKNNSATMILSQNRHFNIYAVTYLLDYLSLG